MPSAKRVLKLDEHQRQSSVHRLLGPLLKSQVEQVWCVCGGDICTSNKFLGDADASGLGTTIRDSLLEILQLPLLLCFRGSLNILS